MKLENQVVPIEQAKRLFELGVNAPSIFLWYKANNGYEVVYNEDVVDFDTNFNAYTVAELGVMLPEQYIVRKSVDGWEYKIPNTDSDWSNWRNHSTEAEARAAMLIFLLESGLVTANEVNKRLSNEKDFY